MAQIDTSIYRNQRTGIDALGGLAQSFRDRGQMQRQRQFDEISFQKAEADRLERERKARLADEQERRAGAFRQDFQDMGYTPGMSDPRELGDLYTEHYPEETARQQLKQMGRTGSGQWVAVPGRAGWQMNKVTGEYRQSEEVSGSIGAYKQAILDDKTARRTETKARREQRQVQDDRTYAFGREKLAIQMEELRENRGDKLYNKATKLSSSHYNKSKDFVKQRDAYDRIEASAQDPSAAGDLALIFNFMKVLDPGSTVREGEFATAESAAGVDDRTRNLFNKVSTGQKLGATQRADFVKRSKLLFDRALKNQAKLDEQVTSKAKLFKIDPALVLYDYKSASESPTVAEDKIVNSAVERAKARRGR